VSNPAASVRRATLAEAALLPALEASAGEAFRVLPDLAWIADHTPTSAEEHRQFIENGLSLIALQDGTPIGFLVADAQGDGLHIWELAVALPHQRRGHGGRLIDAALAYAREKGFAAVTLTTFRNVPWNGPYYKRLGFIELPEANIPGWLSAQLKGEAERGLQDRCAMALTLRARG
jgi:GNAT superfamily N-acetyltransferase